MTTTAAGTARRPDGALVPDLAVLARAAERDRGTERLLAAARAAGYGTDVEQVDRDLAELRRALVEPEIRVAFGGHFSSGKSTLLNALVHRDLLPTDDFPETGVPCVLRGGTVDGAWTVTGEGARPLPLTTRSIADEVSLVDAAGDTRDVRGTAQVEVSLTGERVPPGLAFVDSPGINDTTAMTERAAGIAAGADVLVWVVSSRHPVSETEQRFLGDHVGRSGPALVPVVNVFLDGGGPDEWVRYLERRADDLRHRVCATIPGVRPEEVLLVAARAAVDAPQGFGLPDVGYVINRLASRAGRCAVAARRARRAADVLETRGRELDDHAARRRVVLTASALEHTSAMTAVTEQRARLASELRSGLDVLFAQYRALAEPGVAGVVASARQNALRRDDHYRQELQAVLDWASNGLFTTVHAQLQHLCAAHHQTSSDLLDPSDLHTRCGPPRASVTIPNTTNAGGGSGAGAVIGGILGTMLIPGAGTAIGAALGAGIGGGGSALSSREADKKAAVANTEAAGRAAITQVCDRRGDLERHLLGRMSSTLPIPAAPDPTGVEAIEQLATGLHELAARATDAAEGLAPAEDIPSPRTAAPDGAE